MISYRFAPDIERARTLDRNMHVELAKSLAHVIDAAQAEIPSLQPILKPVIASINGGGIVTPAAFGCYYELVSAILAEDRVAAIEHAGRIARLSDPADLLPVIALGSPPDEVNDLYFRLMNADTGGELAFRSPDPAVADAFRARLASGFELLDRAVPELAGEIRSIVRQIIIAGGDPSQPMQFDGASHYQLWGALFLNGAFHTDAIAVAEVLAHESAHSLLFGFCTQQALVENEDDELFASPLRLDLRPMDGIYHATFVSARIHWSMLRLAESDVLGASERKRAADAADLDLQNFLIGDDVIREHGRLTEVGSAILDSAREYIAHARVAA